MKQSNIQEAKHTGVPRDGKRIFGHKGVPRDPNKREVK